MSGGGGSGGGAASDKAYGATWDGNTTAASENAIYDQMELRALKTQISDTAYGSGWDSNATAPSKNAVYDQMELRATKANPTLTGTVTHPVTYLPTGSTRRSVNSATATDMGNATLEAIDIALSATPITSFASAPAGTVKFVRFTGIVGLTYNGTSLILPGARSITTEANDRATFVSLGSGNWLCQEFLKINGKSLGDTPIYTHAGAEAASAVSMYGGWHNVTGAYTITLPAAVIGMSGTFTATTGAVMTLDCNGADHFDLSGTASLRATHWTRMDSPAVRSRLCVIDRTRGRSGIGWG